MEKEIDRRIECLRLKNITEVSEGVMSGIELLLSEVVSEEDRQKLEVARQIVSEIHRKAKKEAEEKGCCGPI